MGVLLRDALAHQGVSFRVVKPYDRLPPEYLVAQADLTGPRVWIHGCDCNGSTHYDIPRAGLLAVAAVVTDEDGTRFVFDGFSRDEARPVAQAEACARAVAVFLGLEPREPECTWCQDYGQYPIHDGNTDAVLYHRACENPLCVARRQERAALYAAQLREPVTVGLDVLEPVLCTQCPYGNYQQVPGLDVYACTAGCGHTVTATADGFTLLRENGRDQHLTAYEGLLHIAEPAGSVPPF
ncbi:hypothetical protein EEJ42_15990 [Streptomyces botrytidirepellens]|uniref:Uncharacterized protein n=2 Tax=Streptomyces botrytidirepellens TaxID=2486417 RepID=A0A3M8W9D7_9ACTN|nr:hypothetical protein EEJ42_15990 [Streptomyces botrytidirepellens]